MCHDFYIFYTLYTLADHTITHTRSHITHGLTEFY